MKRILSLICFSLILITQGVAHADIEKNISKNHIQLTTSYAPIKLEDIGSNLYFYLSRSANFNDLLGMKNTKESYALYIGLYGEQHGNDQNIKPVFELKNIPYFILIENGASIKYTLKEIESFSSGYVGFIVKQKDLKPFIEADEVQMMLPLNNGDIEKVELSSELLQIIKKILTCDLREEYKKATA